ncbi:DUF1796 family putative cysteine peptidase [Solidesulfovibrio alcoholivorans]|uniref:DUF1796 family putative cysteine peptidase n=1 Tax=Solidesulfovibrio alcoholivorans TaxID=81406 RepID=UPI000AB487B0|nr:DUF1796 family putative cysteine peptidase [Solidesulfovibrio alcoholivorans]
MSNHNDVIPARNNEEWESAKQQEYSFWNEWFKTRGLEWPEKYLERMDPDTIFPQNLVNLLPSNTKSIDVLDVNAGPLTVLGKKSDGKDICITATDSYADIYDEIIAKYGVTPLVRTLKVDPEEVAEYFKDKQFDLIYTRTALDCCYDPVATLGAFCKILKVHGVIIVYTFLNDLSKNIFTSKPRFAFNYDDKGIYFIDGDKKKYIEDFLPSNVIFEYEITGEDKKALQLSIRYRPKIEAIQGYDKYISLGNNCEVSFQIRRLLGWDVAYYFNWLITPLDSLIRIISNDFSDSLKIEKLRLDFSSEMVVDTMYNISYHFPFQHISFDGSIQKFLDHVHRELQSKMNYLRNRFYQICNSEHNVLYIIKADDSDAKAKIINFQAMLKKKFPAHKFDILVIMRDDAFENKGDWNIPGIFNRYVSFFAPCDQADKADEKNWDSLFQEFSLKPGAMKSAL